VARSDLAELAAQRRVRDESAERDRSLDVHGRHAVPVRHRSDGHRDRDALHATGAYANGSIDAGDPANGLWTGGSALPFVSAGGNPCPFRLTGGWDMRPADVLTGYVSQYDGKIDLNCPTAGAAVDLGQDQGHVSRLIVPCRAQHS
jgi:hypothetical protein